MSFFKVLRQWRAFDFAGYLRRVTAPEVEAILSRERLSELDFLALLAPAAAAYREAIAQRAAQITRRRFGNAILLFTPLYISNYCENSCAYCSFCRKRKIKRKKLTLSEIKKESEKIAAAGIRHILLLTGEAPQRTPLSYLRDAVALLKEYFASIAIEIYPLKSPDYKALIAAGVDGLTMYQEVYNQALYRNYHCGGPKENYRYRLDTPERALHESLRAVTVGPLLGLGDPIPEIFMAALHAGYLWKKYPAAEVSLSLPRLRPLAGEFAQPFAVDDVLFVRMLIALRLFLPAAGITISTRESADFRNALLPLGVTKMSAGVSTAVGGRQDAASVGQFEIADSRSVREVCDELLKRGYQPVMHDWNSKLDGEKNGHGR